MKEEPKISFDTKFLALDPEGVEISVSIVFL
jgi:hypothetical protein